MTEPMRVISLGWGVQSFGLAAMSALGVLPPVDAAVHADTTHERSATYVFAARWTPWLEERGVRVVTVRAPDTTVFYPQHERYMIPVYVDANAGGQVNRKCTREWKVAPNRRWLQANRNGRKVELQLGITLDEWQRMRDSDVQYIKHIYPFMDLDWRRSDVVRWLLANGLEVPVKSSCIFCPYHNNATWREIKMSGNGDWTKAIEIDREGRHLLPGRLCYIHRSLQPLESVDLRNAQDHGQLTLWDEDECTGTCFL